MKRLSIKPFLEDLKDWKNSVTIFGTMHALPSNRKSIGEIMNPRVVYVIFCITAVLSAPALAQEKNIEHCVTSKTSCEFYVCAEETYQCGDSGYLLDVGLPLCSPDDYNFKKDSKLDRLTLRIRQCLQEKLIIASPQNCSDLKRDALDSHIPCFIEHGYCGLSFKEKVKVFKNPIDFILIAGLSKMNSLWSKLRKGCKNEEL